MRDPGNLPYSIAAKLACSSKPGARHESPEKALAASVILQAFNDLRYGSLRLQAMEFLTGSGAFRPVSLFWFNALDLKPLTFDQITEARRYLAGKKGV